MLVTCKQLVLQEVARGQDRQERVLVMDGGEFVSIISVQMLKQLVLQEVVTGQYRREIVLVMDGREFL